MSKIDYDGIQLSYEAQIIESDKQLLDALLDAVKDEELAPFTFHMEWVICDYCRGNGGHSRRFGAMSSDEFAEWSDESREAYLRGAYDDRCEACDGSGKVYEMNEGALPEEVIEFIDNYRQYAFDSASESRAERIAGC